MGYRFHVLGVPHTISTAAYSACAFTQKVVKLCRLLTERGHTVIHYGHAASDPVCTEHVTVTTDDDLLRSYGAHDWRRQGFPRYAFDDPVYTAFFAQTIAAIGARKRPGDFLLCTFGANHKPVADMHGDLIVCEPGIGYPGGGFAPFRVFESYAILHVYLGMPAVREMNNGMWYDVVIPNYYDLAEFEVSPEPEDYFLFLGRIGAGKGVNIALQTVEAIGGRLIVAGQGQLAPQQTLTDRPLADYVEVVGLVGPEERKRLLSRARATLTPSVFVEPFCGVHVESMLSGTPVITSDVGAFAEYNVHGTTGFRCRTFEHFTWAARNIGTIDRAACRRWAARNFSLERVGAMYDEYFYSVRNVYGGKGWYEPNPGRTDLDWLKKYPPGEGEA